MLLIESLSDPLSMNANKTEFIWGLKFVAVQLLWMVIEKTFGLHDVHIDKHIYLTNLFAILAITVYVFALRDKRDKDLGGSITFAEAFKSGMILTVVVTILAPVTQWITSTIITPDYFTYAIEHSVETGFHSTLAEAENYFNLKNYMIQSTMGTFIMGLITSFIVGFIIRTKTKKPALT